MSTKYREVLYANYHTNQSGRASLTDAKSLFERERKQFEREILPKLSDVKNEARIFDLGCGSGSLLMALKMAGYTNLLGMDLSDEQVKMAHEMGVSEVVLGDAMQFLRDAMLSCGFSEVTVLPSTMRVQGVFKEIVRRIAYDWMELFCKLQLFATARSTRKVLFTPNLIIVGRN